MGCCCCCSFCHRCHHYCKTAAPADAFTAVAFATHIQRRRRRRLPPPPPPPPQRLNLNCWGVGRVVAVVIKVTKTTPSNHPLLNLQLPKTCSSLACTRPTSAHQDSNYSGTPFPNADADRCVGFWAETCKRACRRCYTLGNTVPQCGRRSMRKQNERCEIKRLHAPPTLPHCNDSEHSYHCSQSHHKNHYHCRSYSCNCVPVTSSKPASCTSKSYPTNAATTTARHPAT